MSLFLELHLLQNFVPSNLNRDDTNAPKDCEFGGFRRARISSQCLKRAIRVTFASNGHVDDPDRARRTKHIATAVAERLTAGYRHDHDEAVRVAASLLEGA